MSTPSRKGKDHKCLAETNAQLTKSRNMAEQNLLRHKLKGLEDQRRRSILAISEEERLLMKDLENQKRDTQPSGDGDTNNNNSSNSNNEQQGHYNANARRNSYRCSIRLTGYDDEDSTSNNNITNNKNNNDINRVDHDTALHASEKRGRKAGGGRKHLWKYSTSSPETLGEADKKSSVSTISNALLHKSSVRKPNQSRPGGASSKDSKTDDVKTDLSHIAKMAAENNFNNNKSRGRSMRNSIIQDSSFTNSDLTSNPPDISMALSSRTPRSGRKTKANKESNVESLIVKDPSPGLGEDFSKTTSEDGRKTSLSRCPIESVHSASLDWSSLGELDKKSDRSYQLNSKQSRKLSRSINIDIDCIPTPDEEVTKSDLSCKTIIGVRNLLVNNDRNFDPSKDENSMIGNSSKHKRSLKPKQQDTDISRSLSQINTSSKDCDNILSNSLLSHDIEKHILPPRKSIQFESNQTDTCKSILTDPHLSSAKTELNSPLDSVMKNGFTRNRIVLSPIASGRASSEKGFVPSCSEKQRTPKQKFKNRRKQKLEPLSQPLEHDIGSDFNVPNSLRKCSILSNSRKSCGQINLEVPSRPMSSWSQRRRSLIFGEDPPTTAREVLNDTHAQWEELGEFLGEIRKQHHKDQAKFSSSRPESKTRNSLPHSDQSTRDFASLVNDRLLPRRHSESNILLLSHAVRNKRDVLDLKPAPHYSHSRRNSCIPPDHPCAVPGHSKRNSSVKKLVTIHNVLQNSALSMADMESETF